MKKYLFIIITFLLLTPIAIYADDSTISISSSKTVVKTGDTFTVDVDISCQKAIGYYEYTLDYDHNKLKLTSGSSYNVDKTNDKDTKKVSKSFKFKVLKEGTSEITVKAYAVTDINDNYFNTKVNPVTIKTGTETTKSNNYLSNLEVEGYKFSPMFNKKNNDYKLIIDKIVEKVNIIAEAEDENSRVTGDGVVSLNPGDNKIKIKVSDENGKQNIYTIQITVKDKNPIKVTIEGKEYTIIKDAKVLKAPDNYIVKEITINGQDITALYNKTTKYTLVGLKDKNNNIELYIYNENNDSYILYKELKFDESSFILLSTNDIPEGYSKYIVTINDNDLDCYKLNSYSDFCLIYGINTKTGYEGWYSYNEKENTLQVYNKDIDNYYQKEIKDTQILIYILGGTSLLFGITVIILASKLSRRKRK